MDLNTIIIVLAQIFGLISWIILLYSYTKENIDELLYLQILVAIFDIASYLLLGADAALLICLFELIRAILYYTTNKDKIIFRVSIIIYILIGLLTIKNWYAILPIFASLIDSYGTSKDSRMANICSIISNFLWTIYDLLIISYIGAINDIVVILCNISVLLLGYSRIMHISKFRIIKYNYLNKKTLDKIYELDLKNFGKENTWDKKYQLDIYKRNNNNNYLNLTYDEYERIKKLRKIPISLDINNIREFKSNRKNYILIESVNVKKEYEKEQTINLICKKIVSFINIKYRKKIYIHGILGIALTDFENKVYNELGFNIIKDLDSIKIYELDNVKKYLK